MLANRKFGELGPGTAFALDDADLAPFFVADGVLPKRWRAYFSEAEVVLSYLYDPAGIFETNVRRCGVTTFISGPYRIAQGEHATEQLARPLSQLGIAITDWEPRIELTDADRETADEPFAFPLIALHPGSGSRGKNWPIENWLLLIDDLLVRENRVIIVGGEADGNEVGSIRKQFGERIGYALAWPLRRLAALLADTIFVGHDSGVSHLAAATGARCVILFGPTDPRVWAPRNKNARVLIAPDGDLRRLAPSQVRAELEV